MKSVYLLQHSYLQDNVEETKIIGIYSIKEEAEKTIENYRLKPGFSNYKEEFIIDEYIINKSYWEEGF